MTASKRKHQPVDYSYRGLLMDSLFPSVFTTILTVLSFVVLIPLSWVELELEDRVLVAVCVFLMCGPLWWLANLWLCRKGMRPDLYLISYTAAMFSLLPPLVSLCFEAFLYFYDDDTLAIQATLGGTQVVAIYMQIHLFFEVGKISSSKGLVSTYEEHAKAVTAATSHH